MLEKLNIGIIFFCVFLFSSINAFAQQVDAQVTNVEFIKMDADKDGLVSSHEMSWYHEKRFNELDSDKNGVLDKEELGADETKMFEKADKNQDEKVTPDESGAQFKEYLRQMDYNDDGMVSEAEYTDYWKLIKRF